MSRALSAYNFSVMQMLKAGDQLFQVGGGVRLSRQSVVRKTGIFVWR